MFSLFCVGWLACNLVMLFCDLFMIGCSIVMIVAILRFVSNAFNSFSVIIRSDRSQYHLYRHTSVLIVDTYTDFFQSFGHSTFFLNLQMDYMFHNFVSTRRIIFIQHFLSSFSLIKYMPFMFETMLNMYNPSVYYFRLSFTTLFNI